MRFILEIVMSLHRNFASYFYEFKRNRTRILCLNYYDINTAFEITFPSTFTPLFYGVVTTRDSFALQVSMVFMLSIIMRFTLQLLWYLRLNYYAIHIKTIMFFLL
jgi:hypothetical protein